MANKILPFNINKLKQKDDNFFSFPQDYLLRKAPGYVKYTYEGLKPNTRYKVAIDNNPDNLYEDLTPWCRPDGPCLLVNLDDDQVRNRKFIKSDAQGRIEFWAKPYGTDVANYSTAGTFTPPHLGSPVNTVLPDYTDYWTQLGNRSSDNDKSRERIRIIEYSEFIDPSSDDKVKATSTDPKPIYGDVPLPGKDEPKTPTGVGANVYQTFFVDSKVVNNSDCVDITDVSLYFRRKPLRDKNLSGIKDPSVTVMLMACKDDGTPDPTQVYQGGFQTKRWSAIQASSTALVETIFTFKDPIRVKTNKMYCFAVKLQDQDYLLWENTKGDLLIVDGDRTETRSSGSTKEHLGDMFEPRSFTKNALSSGAAGELEWVPNKNKDLKFDVHIAQYDTNNLDVELCLKDYEFIKLTGTTPRWAPGEIVYKDVTPEAGISTITKGKRTITNNGLANFSTLVDGDKLVLSDTTDPTKIQAFTVDTSFFTPTATQVVVKEVSLFTMAGDLKHTVTAEVDFFNTVVDSIRLINSSVNPTQFAADNTKRFATGDVIIGIESFNSGTIDGVGALPVSTFRTNWNGTIPPMFSVDTAYNFSVFVESSNTYSLQTENTLMYLNSPNHVKGYKSEVLSRSIEVEQTGLAPTTNKSATFDLSYVYNGEGTNAFCAPVFRTDSLSLVMHKWTINNDSTGEYLPGNKGAALSKSISKKLNFGQEKPAEDLRVIANVHTPVGTSIEFYAKVHNSNDPDAFDDKQWTKLLQLSGRDTFDNKDDRFSYHEVEYQLPFFPTSTNTLDGSITTTLDSTTLTFDDSANTAEIDALTQGEVIKLYSTLFPTNYQLFSVESANGSLGTVTLQQPVSNTNMVGTDIRMDTLLDQNTAYRNPDNFEISRYFGYSGQTYDGFDQVTIKIVMLSENSNVVPKLDDYRVIGVSA